tara:strand:- start:1059 stop:2636 length:1578 start_codon:yes stop_codon:yes gene_type:complete
MTRTGTTSIITDWYGQDEIWFQHTQDAWAVNLAITTALASAGIKVDGYSASWEVFNRQTNTINGRCTVAKTNGVCIDPLTITLTAKDSNGNNIYSQIFDYGAMNTHNINPSASDPHWYQESVLSWIGSGQLTPGSGIASVDINIAGYDAGFWQGNYGPRVKNMVGSLILSVDICASTPLHSSSCPGYATAYATQQYNTNCAANALYDPGCPGYTALFQTQQCNANPLFSTACPGYTTAFFNQQCTQDPQYDQNCPGFVVEEAAAVVVSAETIAEPSITGDSIVDAILSETVTVEQNPVTVTPVQIEVVTPVVVAVAPVQESNTFDTPEETVASASDNLEGSIEQEIKAFEESSTENTTEEIVVEVEETTEEVVEESVAEITEDGSEEVVVEETTDKEETIEEVVVEEKIVKKPTPKKVLTKKQKAKAKAKKIKEIVQARGKSLAQQMSTAATVEVQKQLQNQLLAIIGFVPDFSKYGKTNIDGGNLQQEVNLKGGRIVDHQFSRWFLNDPGFAALEEQQYNLRSN